MELEKVIRWLRIGNVDQHNEVDFGDIEEEAVSLGSLSSLQLKPKEILNGLDDNQLEIEINSKWILNLSMNIRDNSDCEKFFLTYAQYPNEWLRVTVSIDYRNLQQDSLGAGLKSCHYQRDKSTRIYEAIRGSLPDICFYPTVTNLKLETCDGKLHIHVTEDVSEVIKYPSVSCIEHIDCPRVKESAIEFHDHCIGFVYKIRTSLKGSSTKCIYIKKEIPGPGSVDEFLYEINALSKLKDSPHIISFEGLVLSDDGKWVKGLLITYAPGGTLVDLLYSHRLDATNDVTLLSLERRLKYARQIVKGLSTIHGSGFVHGDFTLSNIVLDEEDNALLIDINRKGCPMGWEPPEFKPIIRNDTPLGMYIGVKSDVWQCGMILWALGRGIDKPESDGSLGHWDNLAVEADSKGVPIWYKEIVSAALEEYPRDRKSAAELLDMFPQERNNVEESNVGKYCKSSPVSASLLSEKLLTLSTENFDESKDEQRA